MRKAPNNGVDYTGDVKDCGPCPLGKSTQQPHPKAATYDVQRPFQLVFVDTLGPFSPTALGGFKYVTKFVDQLTKWKDVVLMKDKDSLCGLPRPVPERDREFLSESVSTSSAGTRARSSRTRSSSSSVKTPASSLSLLLRTLHNRSERTSVRGGRFLTSCAAFSLTRLYRTSFGGS